MTLDASFSTRTMVTLLILVFVATGPVRADETIRFDIPAQDLGKALNVFAAQSKLQVAVAPKDVRGKKSRATRGAMTPRAALDRLLEGSDLEYAFVNGNTVAIRKRNASPSNQEQVTGTIRGRVTLPDGAAAPGATVTAMGSDGQRLRKTVITDQKGSYVFHDLAPGNYTLTFDLTGLAPTEEKVTAVAGEDTIVDITLRPERFGEDIVVVGSRLGSTPVESALPIKVLDREQIDRSGATNIAQALSLLPEVSVNNNGDAGSSEPSFAQGSVNATTVQLRGLPLGTTLVLVNGRRVGVSAAFAELGSNSFFDLGNIPLSMVERIEVLPFGASAVYGGDGLAGVVNIVTKRNAQGLDVRVRNGMARGYDQTQASMTWGKAWSRGSLTAAASFARSGALSTGERSLTRNQDFRRFGGRDFRSAAGASAGTIYSLAGCPPAPAFCTVPLNQRGNLPGLNAPFAGVPAGQDGRGLTPSDFAATAGIQNVDNFHENIFSPSEATSITLQGQYEIGPRMDVFMDLLYTKREIPPSEATIVLSSGEFGNFRVSADNPFNPFGVEVSVDVLQQTTGVFDDYQPEYLKPTLGVRGGWGAWAWELAGSLSKDLTDANIHGMNADAVRAALISSDPATALNVFRGDGSLGSQELIQTFFTSFPGVFRSDVWQANGFVRGPAVRLPAGPVEMLLGVEWERQELQIQSAIVGNVSGNDESRSVFSELRLPLLSRARGSGGPAGELLALTAAFRADQSDRFEQTGTTETVGLEVRPASALLLRVSTASAFKPLSMFDAFQDLTRTPNTFSVRDPKMGGKRVVLRNLIRGGGVPPNLEPETSSSNAAGLVWFPESLAGLNVSVTAWENRVRNRLAFLARQFIVDNEDSFPGRVTRDPQTGEITELDARVVNIARTDVEGVDLGLSWRWSTKYGDFSPALAATWIGKHEEQITPTSPVRDRLGVVDGFTWSPRWKGTTILGWAFEDEVQTTLIGRYVSTYQDPRPLDTGPMAGTIQTLGDFWLVDLNVDMSLGRWLAPGTNRLSGTHLSIGAVNLLNRQPDFCNGCGRQRGYDTTQEDIRGRFAYAEIKFNF